MQCLMPGIIYICMQLYIYYNVRGALIRVSLVVGCRG